MSDAHPPSASLPEIDEMLCFSIYSAGHAFNKIYKPLLDELGLTYPQFLVMVALWAKDEQTVGALGEKLSLESSTLTPLLKRLEANGYLARKRDLADERQVRISLTAAGAALRARAAEVPQCIKSATGLTEESLRLLTGQIAALRQSLLASAKAAAS
jgi:DNA-binding MarR family transcriptional regulator